MLFLHPRTVTDPGIQSKARAAYRMNPPSTVSTCPVIKSASSRSRNATAFATSSGDPSRPAGVWSTRDATVSSPSPFTMSVSMTPGATQLTRMWEGASSMASDRVSPITAALDAA